MRWILRCLITTLLVVAAATPLSSSADPAPKYSVFPIADGPLTDPYPWAVRAELYAEIAYYTDGPAKVVAQSWRKRLSAQQLAAIETNIIRKTSSLEGAVAACCDPHHYVRYYDRQDRLVGQIAICFCCGCVRAEPYVKSTRGQELDFNHEALRRLVADLGLPTDIQCYHPPSP